MQPSPAIPELNFRPPTTRSRLLYDRYHPIAVMALTLATGGLFKCAAFAREAFIASHFGLTAATDGYFGLQQVPLSLATFMFGAFALAFTPAYAEAKQRRGQAEWLPGLVFYGFLIGTAMMVGMLLCAPFLVRAYSGNPNPELWCTLAILSLCHIPIVFIGFWSGICVARGHNVSALSVTGFPYLLMTIALFALHAAKALDNLSLPISMAAGFGIVGLYSFIRIAFLQTLPTSRLIISPWKFEEFRCFLRQMAASALENGGYVVNQMMLLYSLSQIGTGILSASNCAMRIGTLGFTLVGQPAAQLIQAQLCVGNLEERAKKFKRWMLLASAGVVAITGVLMFVRVPVVRLIYVRGQFQEFEMNEVVALTPAWIIYFLIMALNGFVARYMFIRAEGSLFLRRQLWSYGLAIVGRLALADDLSGAGIIWCTATAQLLSFALNLKSCLTTSTNGLAFLPRLKCIDESTNR